MSTYRGLPLSLLFLALALGLARLAGFGGLLRLRFVLRVGLVFAFRGSTFSGGNFVRRPTEEESALRCLPRDLLGHLLSSPGLDDLRVLDSVSLRLQKLLSADAEVFFKERRVAPVCFKYGDADVTHDGHETNNGRYGLVPDHPVVKPQRTFIDFDEGCSFASVEEPELC